MAYSASGKTLITIQKLAPDATYLVPNGVVIDIIGIDATNSFTINALDGTVSDPISADLSSPESFMLNVDVNSVNRPVITCVTGTINVLVYQ
jgi:hypothetical protein